MSESRTLLSRRHVLGAAGLGTVAVALPVSANLLSPAAAAATESAAATCSADTAEQEVGPFYVAEGIVRSDVTAGQTGIPVTFTLTITNVTTCGPLVGAAVDIWHANAAGVYSDESSESTIGQKWLRGTQITDATGQVTFTTVYPGWYSGRTEHIHHRVYTGGSVSDGTYSFTGATLVHTGQLFFPATTNDTVAADSKYSSNATARTTNAADRVYTQQSGANHILTLTGDTTSGYTGSATIGVGTSSTTTTTKDATSLTLIPSAQSITAGKGIVISGVLTDTTTAKVLAGQPVNVTAVNAAGTSVTKTTTTNSAGVWSVSVTPVRTTYYRASFAGTTALAASLSPGVTVAVAHNVAFTHISSTADASEQIVAKGRIVPADKGVTVRLRTTKSGSVHTLATVKTASDGTWKASWRMKAGSHPVFAVAAATKLDTAVGKSRTITVVRS